MRMLGVHIDGSTNVFCDNKAVSVNTTWPKSTLSKKHHSIVDHCAREAVAAGMVIVSNEHTSTNLADLFTKTMVVPKRERLMDKFKDLEANWSMRFSYPSEGLTQSINLLVLKRTKL